MRCRGLPRDEAKAPLFRSAIGRTGALTGKHVNRVDAYRMIQLRIPTKSAGIVQLAHTGTNLYNSRSSGERSDYLSGPICPYRRAEITRSAVAMS